MRKQVLSGLFQYLREVSDNVHWQKFNVELCLNYANWDSSLLTTITDFIYSDASISSSWQLQSKENFEQQLEPPPV